MPDEFSCLTSSGFSSSISAARSAWRSNRQVRLVTKDLCSGISMRFVRIVVKYDFNLIVATFEMATWLHIVEVVVR